ncbi:MAG: Precorrin-3B methylase [Synechococcales cyanobacterium CRU_2_2]|nr:Precorrin-3B methylase [Synechococcales cyanobacterium CRU_2_2]
MPQNHHDQPLEGEALIKETNRRIRVAMAYWKAHNNRACRGERERALKLYNQLTPEQKNKIPQPLRVWLRYRSEKYFGEGRTPPGTAQGKARPKGKPKP